MREIEDTRGDLMQLSVRGFAGNPLLWIQSTDIGTGETVVIELDRARVIDLQAELTAFLEANP